jgi:predicted XRE-type DNA-binding protein
MNFQDAEIGAYTCRKGCMWLAEWLILTTELSNKEIAIISEVSKSRISPLRRKLRT